MRHFLDYIFRANTFFPFFLQEMLGELFTPIETPEAQNRGFLKGFFGGNAHTFDREELCALSVLFFSQYKALKVCITTSKRCQIILITRHTP